MIIIVDVWVILIEVIFVMEYWLNLMEVAVIVEVTPVVYAVEIAVIVSIEVFVVTTMSIMRKIFDFLRREVPKTLIEPRIVACVQSILAHISAYRKGKVGSDGQGALHRSKIVLADTLDPSDDHIFCHLANHPNALFTLDLAQQAACCGTCGAFAPADWSNTRALWTLVVAEPTAHLFPV